MLRIISIKKTMARGFSVSAINDLIREIDRGACPLAWIDDGARPKFDPISYSQREMILAALRALAE